MTLTIEPLLKQPLTWYQPPSPQAGDVWMAPITTITSRRSRDGADPNADLVDWLTWFRDWKQSRLLDIRYDWRMQHIPWWVVLQNCRTHPTFDDLTESIATVGIVTPLSVVLEHGDWQLYDGHHRLAAALDLGLHAVPIQAIRPADASLLWRATDRVITL